MAAKPKTSAEDAVILALFAQRSPNGEFRDRAFALALAALGGKTASAADLAPFSKFAARSQAKGASAERAREVGKRLLREAGHSELLAQLSASAKS